MVAFSRSSREFTGSSAWQAPLSKADCRRARWHRELAEITGLGPFIQELASQSPLT